MPEKQRAIFMTIAAEEKAKAISSKYHLMSASSIKYEV